MSIPAGWPGRIVQDLLSFIGKGGSALLFLLLPVGITIKVEELC